MAIGKSVLFRLGFSLLLAFLFFAGCLVLQVEGIDWHAYSTTKPNYFAFYFYREFLSWWIITTLSVEPTYFYNALVGCVLYFLLVHSSLSFTNSILQTFGKYNKTYLVYAITPFLTTNFYVLLSINGMRQGLSSAFLLYSFSFFLSQKGGWASFLFLLAVFSHNASAFYFPIFILFLLPIKTLYKMAPIVAISMIFLGGVILQVAGKSDGASTTNNTIAFSLALLVIYAFCRFAFRNDRYLSVAKDKYAKGILTSFLFYVVFSVFAVITDEMSFERLVYYSFLIVIPFMVASLSRFRGAKYIVPVALLVSPLILFLFFTTNAYQMQFLVLRP